MLEPQVVTARGARFDRARELAVDQDDALVAVLHGRQEFRTTNASGT